MDKNVSVNEGFDKRMMVTGRVSEGTLPKEAFFTVVHLGLREPFIPADSDEPFQDSTGEDFGTLKNEQ